MEDPPLNRPQHGVSRREFIASMLRGGLATALTFSARFAFAQKPSPPRNLRLRSQKQLLTASDFTFLGMFKFPDNDNWNYANGPIALRIVNGARRWISIAQDGSSPREIQEPDTLGLTLASAPSATETNLWADSLIFDWGGDDDAGQNGTRIGGLLWDEDWQVLWYTYYPYYHNGSHPFLGAVALKNDGSSVQYPGNGKCWTVDGDIIHTKRLNGWIVPLPSDLQSLVGGRKWAFGAGIIAQSSPCSYGPNLIALDKPALNRPYNQLLTGVPLLDFSNVSGLGTPEHYYRRDANYYKMGTSDSLYNSIENTGYWASSLDLVAGCAWVTKGNKNAVIYTGRLGHGALWYGDGPDYQNQGILDPCTEAHGFHAQSYDPNWWFFDPADLCAVARGRKKFWIPKDYLSINPKNYWSNLEYTCDIVYNGEMHGNAFFDSLTNRLYTLHGRAYNPNFSRLPVMHVWQVN